MPNYPYPLFDENNKLICQICGKSYLVVNPMHLKSHGVTFQEYKDRFPDAPLSSKEHKARGKYGKNKDLFIHPDEEVIVEEEINPLEELMDVERFAESEKVIADPMTRMKRKILEHLRTHFSNMKMDYLIQQHGLDKRLKFEFITDFCDPILKVVVQFPDTFWHNHDLLIDLNKTIKLEQYGWRVIKIHSNNPSFNTLDKAIVKQ